MKVNDFERVQTLATYEGWPDVYFSESAEINKLPLDSIQSNPDNELTNLVNHRSDKMTTNYDSKDFSDFNLAEALEPAGQYSDPTVTMAQKLANLDQPALTVHEAASGLAVATLAVVGGSVIEYKFGDGSTIWIHAADHDVIATA